MITDGEINSGVATINELYNDLSPAERQNLDTRYWSSNRDELKRIGDMLMALKLERRQTGR